MSGWTLAIDFGTSFTTAATWRDGRLNLVEVGGSQSSQFRMPSAVWVDPGGDIVVGWHAERQAPLAPERLERAPKQLLGDAEPMQLGRVVHVEEAVGAVLAAVLEEARRQEGGSDPERVILTHPASWPARRRAALNDAAARAGIREPILLEEPVGAAVYFTGPGANGGARVEEGSSVAVYDLGGGTFDTAILRRTEDGGFEPIGVGGRDGLGGEMFDTRLFRHLRKMLLDSAAKDWHAIERSPRALQSFRREVRAAKEALSVHGAHDVVLPEVTELPSLRVTRGELEDLIDEDIRESVDILVRTCEQAGVEPAQLGGVFLVGGSSRIPLVGERIARQLGCVPDTRDNPKAAVALGAAAAGSGHQNARAGVLGATQTTPTRSPDLPTTLAPGPAAMRLGGMESQRQDPEQHVEKGVAEPARTRTGRRPPRQLERAEPRGSRLRWWVAGFALLAVAAVALMTLAQSGEDSGGETVTHITVGKKPSDVAIGFGSAWTANSGDSSVSRVQGGGGAAARIKTSFSPSRIAAGADSVWVLGAADLARIDPETGQASKAFTLAEDPSDIAVGFDALWVANGADNSVSKLIPATGREIPEVAGKVDVGRSPQDVAAGEGAVWVVNSQDNTVQQIDPTSAATVGGAIDLKETTFRQSIAVGAGSVWVSGDTGWLFRINPRTGKGVAKEVAGEPIDLAVGARSVWVLDATGVVREVNPASLAVIGKPVRTGDQGAAVAVGEGAVWVVNDANQLGRLPR